MIGGHLPLMGPLGADRVTCNGPLGLERVTCNGHRLKYLWDQTRPPIPLWTRFKHDE